MLGGVCRGRLWEGYVTGGDCVRGRLGKAVLGGVCRGRLGKTMLGGVCRGDWGRLC